MIAVIGMLLILVSAGGIMGVLSMGTFTALAVGVVGASLLCVGVHSSNPESKRNGNVRTRG